MLRRVILCPKSIYVLPRHGMYDTLNGVTASAYDHRYGLTLSLIVLLGLKKTMHALFSGKN